MAEFHEEVEHDFDAALTEIDIELAENDFSNWACGDDNGYAYYYNSVTGKSVWEKPACMLEIAKRGFARSLSSLLDEKIDLEPPPLSLRIFHQFDKDNSGYIDADELQVMAYHFGIWLSGDALKVALMTMDHDGNGEISYEEFLHWFKDSSFSSLKLDDDALERRNLAASIFQKYDADKSGSIDQEEFVHMHAEMVREGLTTVHVEDVMAEIDVDGDGLIQFNEFGTWLEKCTHVSEPAEAVGKSETLYNML